MININILSLTKLEAFISKFIHCRSVWKCQRLHFCKRCLLWLQSNLNFLTNCLSFSLISCFLLQWSSQSKISCCFVHCRMTQNSKSTHATILQLLVAKLATQSWRNYNPKLQSHYAICSCSYSDYQLKKIATKSCLQLKIAIHNFLQLLVELRLLSGCKNLQCKKIYTLFRVPLLLTTTVLC